MPKPNSFVWKEMARHPLSLFKWEEKKYVSLMNSISSRGLFWAKQPLALFALLISQMGKLADTWHHMEKFINFFLLPSWDFSSILGSEYQSLEMCWKNGEHFLFVLLSYSICLRTGSFSLGSQYQAPIHDSWLCMRHILLQIFLERDVNFHLGKRKSQASTPTKEPPFYILGKFKMFAHSLVPQLCCNPFLFT